MQILLCNNRFINIIKSSNIKYISNDVSTIRSWFRIKKNQKKFISFENVTVCFPNHLYFFLNRKGRGSHCSWYELWNNFCSFPSAIICFDLIIALIKTLLFLKLFFSRVVVVAGKTFFQLLKILHFPQYCTFKIINDNLVKFGVI